tara:strand:- start:324 stop:467 length:144 start_codon:yes stop_codon:yes gene_type:complete
MSSRIFKLAQSFLKRNKKKNKKSSSYKDIMKKDKALDEKNKKVKDNE